MKPMPSAKPAATAATAASICSPRGRVVGFRRAPLDCCTDTAAWSRFGAVLLGAQFPAPNHPAFELGEMLQRRSAGERCQRCRCAVLVVIAVFHCRVCMKRLKRYLPCFSARRRAKGVARHVVDEFMVSLDRDAGEFFWQNIAISCQLRMAVGVVEFRRFRQWPFTRFLGAAFFDPARENDLGVGVGIFVFLDLAVAALDHGGDVVEGEMLGSRIAVSSPPRH